MISVSSFQFPVVSKAVSSLETELATGNWSLETDDENSRLHQASRHPRVAAAGQRSENLDPGCRCKLRAERARRLRPGGSPPPQGEAGGRSRGLLRGSGARDPGDS